jgi:hypothetical protein
MRSPRSGASPRVRTGSARTATGRRGNNAELLDLIAHVREVTGKPVGIKTVMGHLAHFEELFDGDQPPRAGKRTGFHHAGWG